MHISGVGQQGGGSGGLGLGFQVPSSGTGAGESGPAGSRSSSAPGSDILDSNTHELYLEKSNILLLGPTGSGEYFIFTE